MTSNARSAAASLFRVEPSKLSHHYVIVPNADIPALNKVVTVRSLTEPTIDLPWWADVSPEYPLGTAGFKPAPAGFSLLEVYSYSKLGEWDAPDVYFTKIVGVEVFDQPHLHEEFMSRVHTYVEKTIINQEPLFQRNSFGHISTGYTHAADSLLVQLLAAQNTPSARRMITALEAVDALHTALTRYDLQKALDAQGLGRINGVDLEEFKTLTPDEVVQTLLVSIPAYPYASVAGGLYFLLKKGLSREVFNQWFADFSASNGWPSDPDALRLTLFSLTLAKEPVTSMKVAELGSDSFKTLLHFLENAGTLKDFDANSRFSASSAGGIFMKSTTVEDMIRVHDYLRQSPSEVEDVWSNPDATGFELASALIKAFDSGLTATAEFHVDIFNRLAQPFRMNLVRSGGEMQKWFNALLMASARRENARRPKKA